jgi:ubiquinone/menaquinone biosynthesis C-methylase UbiE
LKASKKRIATAVEASGTSLTNIVWRVASVAMASKHGGNQHSGTNHLPLDWNELYSGTPPWDIGRPQRPFIELVEIGDLSGSVLDVGCGTGDLALLMAEFGLQATGVDIAPAAVATAMDKAEQRGLHARFLEHDALTVDALDETFDVVLDCGFFHVLSDADRVRFAEVLRRVTRPGARYFMLCFSDQVPGDAGPRRVSQDEIRSTFADGFAVEEIRQAYFEATFLTQLVPAWLAELVRVPQELD